MEVLYINEQIKDSNGVIISSGKFGPFESRAELDYFTAFKRPKDFYKRFYEAKIESYDIEKGQQPKYFNKYSNEQLKVLLKKELSYIKFLDYKNDEELFKQAKVLEIFEKSINLALKSCNKKVQSRVNKAVNLFLVFKSSKSPKDLDFELKKVPNEVLKLFINFNKEQEELLSKTNLSL